MRPEKMSQARRILMTFLIQLGMLFGMSTKSTADFYVTSVIREFPMKNGDTTFKDFYINAGTNNGLKAGVYLEAKRKIGVYDNINSKLMGDTSISIARLKIIHTDKNYSVARLIKFYDKEQTPVTGTDNVIVGDLIEVASKQ